MKEKSRQAIFWVYFITFAVAFLITTVIGGMEAALHFPLIGMIASSNPAIAVPFGYFLFAFIAGFGIIGRTYIPYGFFLALLIFNVWFWLYAGYSFRHM